MTTGRKLRVLLIEHDDAWVAQCIEYDLAAQAESLPAVLDEFDRVLQARVSIALERGLDPFADLPSAPAEYEADFNSTDITVSRHGETGLVQIERDRAVSAEVRVSKAA